VKSPRDEGSERRRVQTLGQRNEPDARSAYGVSDRRHIRHRETERLELRAGLGPPVGLADVIWYEPDAGQPRKRQPVTQPDDGIVWIVERDDQNTVVAQHPRELRKALGDVDFGLEMVE